MKPVMEVAAGDTIVFKAMDALRNQIESENTFHKHGGNMDTE